MKTKLLLLGVIAGIAVTMTGCNMQMWDATYKFDRAIITLPNGTVVEGKVDSWLDFEDGDQIQVKINGVSYLTHISNVVLIADKKAD